MWIFGLTVILVGIRKIFECIFLIYKVDTNTCSWPVKGMNLVRELEKDLKVANVICMVSIEFCFIRGTSSGLGMTSFIFFQWFLWMLIHLCRYCFFPHKTFLPTKVLLFGYFYYSFATAATIDFLAQLWFYLLLFLHFAEWTTTYNLINQWGIQGPHCKYQFQEEASSSGIYLSVDTLASDYSSHSLFFNS